MVQQEYNTGRDNIKTFTTPGQRQGAMPVEARYSSFLLFLWRRFKIFGFFAD
jgi:hypothetical protein